MSIGIIVNDERQWPFKISGVNVISAKKYLTDSSFSNDQSTKIFNLCNSYRYQSLGYYVSLLAEARGHKPIPRARTLEDLQSLNLVRLLTEDLDELIQSTLADVKEDAYESFVYFGQFYARPEHILGGQFFNLLKAPLLRVRFTRREGNWHIEAAQAVAADDCPQTHRSYIIQAAANYLLGTSNRGAKSLSQGYDIGILHDPHAKQCPSNSEALKKFAEAAEVLGMHVDFITHADYGRLSQFDALFIRDTTRVNHYTYRFARQAAAENLVVIDDPDSILKCSNKVYLAELLTKHNIATPQTLVVYHDNIDQIVPTLGLPCILKQPDSAFSAGVLKLETEAAVLQAARELLQHSELIIAQEYLPTEFDWRVAILDGRPLFVCKYFMAPGHWQVIKRESSGELFEGKVATLSVGEAPDEVIELALRAAKCIGDGLYGVDLKQTEDRCYVIEVNDNPNIDAGNEDRILKDALYREVMSVFLKRIAARKQGAVR